MNEQPKDFEESVLRDFLGEYWSMWTSHCKERGINPNEIFMKFGGEGDMSTPTDVIINAELAEQHANTLQGIYDINRQGVAVGGRFLEQVLDVIRSLRGLETKQEKLEKAWKGYTELSGKILDHYMNDRMPDGSEVNAPIKHY